MRDLRKGLFILLLGAIASISAFYSEDLRWEMAFINFDTQTNSDIENLQAQLLAGVDPTAIAEPTAVGGSTKKSIIVNCSNGQIIRDKSSDDFHNDWYISIKNTDGSYIEVQDKDSYLLKSTFETQSASVIDALPAAVNEQMILASQQNNCSSVDIYLARIKNI